MADVDTSAWDGNRAMTECSTAEDYNKVCAGKVAGDPALRASHKLPHHYLSKAPVPNADGVRAALQRFSQTQGLTNSGAARSHLEAHMSSIQAQSLETTEHFGMPNPATAADLRAHLASEAPDGHDAENADDMSMGEATAAHAKAHSGSTPRSGHSHSASVEESSLVLTDDGKLLARSPVQEWQLGHSGRPDELFTVKGYAAVFNQRSHDMGGFTTILKPGAFDEVLAKSPDVHFVWNHDTRWVGARTTNGTLKLSQDDHGLFIDAQIGNYSWAKDLRTALERKDIDQGSIALQIGEDEWEIDEETEQITRFVNTADDLFDVTVTAQGAFPQTSLAVAYSLVRDATASGRLPSAGAALVAARGESPSQTGGEEATNVVWIEELKHLSAVRKDEIAALKRRAAQL